MRNEPRAIYRVVSVTPDIITIRDLDDGRSVTNDAERIVAKLIAEWGNKRILYYDTMGNLDELLHEAGVFKGYAPARGTDA